MKKYFVAGLMALIATGSVYAQAAATTDLGDVCTGASAGANGTAFTAGNFFVKASFTPKCSANVYLSYKQDATTFAVGSGSAKGKTKFKGNSNGGGVVRDADCAATTGCVQNDATASAAQAYTDATATTTTTSP